MQTNWLQVNATYYIYQSAVFL